MKTINVVAAIIIDGDRILSTQRGYGEFKGGWEFPGGKIEPHERAEQALIREIKEELDANISVGKLLDTVEYDYPNFHLSMQCFICTLNDPHIVFKEHLDFKWLDKEHLDLVNWLPADVSVIKKLKDYLSVL